MLNILPNLLIMNVYKLSGSLTRTMAPIISIIKSAADILVITPTSRNTPPITSKRPTGRASWGESYTTKKALSSCDIFKLWQSVS
jgi:hypothetical protein